MMRGMLIICYSNCEPLLVYDCPNVFNQIVITTRYKDGPTRDEFPMFESLKLTIDRTLPYWNDVIVPQVSRFFFTKFYWKIPNHYIATYLYESIETRISSKLDKGKQKDFDCCTWQFFKRYRETSR